MKAKNYEFYQLDKRKNEEYFKNKKELSISDVINENNLNENEWVFQSVWFTNMYDCKPTHMLFKNIRTNELDMFPMWK